MTAKRFTNVNEDIFQYGEWYCSAGGEHCADVIATALNELIEENEQLKIQLQNTSAQRDEFHKGARENANRVGELTKEVSALIDENEQLKNLLKDFVRISEDNGAISPIRVKCLVYDYIDGVDVE